MSQSPFKSEYLRCMREFYKNESKEGREVSTLNSVMERVGFPISEIVELYIQGTATLDFDEFTSDRTILAHLHSLECRCGTCAPAIDTVLTETGKTTSGEIIHEKKKSKSKKSKPDTKSNHPSYAKKLL